MKSKCKECGIYKALHEKIESHSFILDEHGDKSGKHVFDEKDYNVVMF